MNSQNDHSEIIIVRRSHDDHDDHHGGVWKIAFADFMTAMMAFFLVMWLINASNEETKKAVASYFNPIKLMDRTSNPKGVRSPKYGAAVKDPTKKQDDESTVISNSKEARVKNEGSAQTFDEQALFTDPYALLSEIASGTDQRNAENNKAEKSGQSENLGMGVNGGVNFQDPFDPKAWSLKYGAQQGKAKESKALEDEMTNGLKPEKLDSKALDFKKEIAEAKPKISMSMQKSKKGQDKKPNKEISKVAKELREEIDKAIDKGGKPVPKIEIVSDENGALITVSEQQSLGMFKIGSAKPTPELVNIMASIGKVISTKSGAITISGHTDGRKYRSNGYDNWRLSTARAHMARYMLLRGGLSEESIEKVEGYASVNLRTPQHPNAAINRRIEIYVRLK